MVTGEGVGKQGKKGKAMGTSFRMGWVIKVEVRVCGFVRSFGAVDECDVYTRANMNN